MPSSKESLESLLKREGGLTYISEGHSMYPLILSGQDVLNIKTINAPIKRGDVLLYKDSKDHYILHRLIRIKRDGTLLLSGDNNSWMDEPVKQERVLGKLQSICKKDGTKIILDKDKGWRRFCCVHFPHLKFFVLKTRRTLRKASRK